MCKKMEELVTPYQEIIAVADSHQTAITERRRNMDKELKNRESRLRYKAEKKGLYIRKESYRINNQKYSGYLIMKQSGLVIEDCNRYWNGLAPIDDAETIIDKY